MNNYELSKNRASFRNDIQNKGNVLDNIQNKKSSNNFGTPYYMRVSLVHPIISSVADITIRDIITCIVYLLYININT